MSKQGKTPQGPRQTGKTSGALRQSAAWTFLRQGARTPPSVQDVLRRYWSVYAPPPNDPRAPSKRRRFWQWTRHQSAAASALLHWRKHHASLPEFHNALQYVKAANAFLRHPPDGALFKTRANGDQLIYDPARNLLGVASSQALPRTLFRPRGGRVYWNSL